MVYEIGSERERSPLGHTTTRRRTLGSNRTGRAQGRAQGKGEKLGGVLRGARTELTETCSRGHSRWEQGRMDGRREAASDGLHHARRDDHERTVIRWRSQVFCTRGRSRRNIRCPQHGILQHAIEEVLDIRGQTLLSCYLLDICSGEGNSARSQHTKQHAPQEESGAQAGHARGLGLHGRCGQKRGSGSVLPPVGGITLPPGQERCEVPSRKIRVPAVCNELYRNPSGLALLFNVSLQDCHAGGTT